MRMINFARLTLSPSVMRRFCIQRRPFTLQISLNSHLHHAFTWEWYKHSSTVWFCDEFQITVICHIKWVWSQMNDEFWQSVLWTLMHHVILWAGSFSGNTFYYKSWSKLALCWSKSLFPTACWLTEHEFDWYSWWVKLPTMRSIPYIITMNSDLLR